MSWIDVIGEDEAEGLLAEIYDAIGARRGKISNIMRVHSLKPRAMQAHMGLYLTVMFERSGLSREEREMVAIAVSAANDCAYCKDHHIEALRAYWKDDARIEAFVANMEEARLDDRQRAVLAYAVKLTKTPTEMTPADLDGLRRVGLDEEQILTLNLVTGYFNFVNRIALGLGVESSEDEMRGYQY